jgi:hypothetical protein
MRQGWSRWHAATSMLVFALLGPSVAAETGPHLSWKFEVNEAFQITLQSSIKTIAVQSGQAFEIPQDRSLELNLTATAVDEQGVASIEGTLTRIHFNTRTPFAGEIDLDSAGVDAGEPEQIQKLQRAFGKAAGLRLSFQWNPAGRATNLKWMDPLPGDLDQHPLLASMLQTEVIASLLNSPVQLPNKTIDVEESWTYQDQRPTAAGPIVFSHRASCKADSAESKNLVQISVATEVELEVTEPEEGATYSVSSSQCQGTATFDTQLKKVVASSQQQRLVFSVEKDGASGEQKLSQNVLFTLTPRNSDREEE